MKQCSHFWKAVILILPTLPTGRLPVRSGIYTAHDWPLDMGFRVFLPISEGGLPATEVTIPQVLKKANYTSALVGREGGREGRMHILSTSYSIVPPLTFTLVLHISTHLLLIDWQMAHWPCQLPANAAGI